MCDDVLVRLALRRQAVMQVARPWYGIYPVEAGAQQKAQMVSQRYSPYLLSIVPWREIGSGMRVKCQGANVLHSVFTTGLHVARYAESVE